MRAGRVVVVGSVNTDFVLRVERRPDPGETVTDALLEVHGGGKGANQALAAAKCGASVELLARVGDDPMGKDRVRQLAAGGVLTSRVTLTPGATSGVAVVTLTPDGQNAIVVAPGANALLSPFDMEAASADLKEADVLLAQFEVPIGTVARAAELAGEKTQVLVNCAPFRAIPAGLLSRLDVLVANELEASQLCGSPISAPREALLAAQGLVGRGLSAVVVTLGAQGAVVASTGLAEHVPAPATKVVDTTGAGDAFTGALAAALAAGKSLLEAVRDGVAVGSATTEHLGAAPALPSQPIAPA